MAFFVMELPRPRPNVNHRKTLKSSFFEGKFDDEFIELAKKELPHTWGRLSLLEEFYWISRTGGDPDRMPQLYAQLGVGKRLHGSALRKLWHAVTG